MKRIIRLIVCAVFIFSSVYTCFPNVSADAATIKVSEDDYTNAEAILKSVCSDITFSNADEVTRADFVLAVTKLMKMPESFSGELTYKDVDKTSPYAAGIAYALELGYISNTSLFYPDSPITYAQAVKIIVCALGYGVKAEYMGGFPVGYLTIANELGVGKSLQLGSDSMLSKKDVTVLLVDACMTDMMDVTSFGSSYEYSTIEGKNILSTYHKIYIATGIVEANKFTGIYGADDACHDDVIKIYGKSFAGKGYSNLIGKNARVFYSEDGKNTIVFAYETGNDAYEYTCEDSLTVSGLSMSVLPNNSDKSIKYNLNDDYSIIYNGKYYGGILNDDLLNPASGIVSFIDNDQDKTIDVIIIKSIEFGVIDFVNEFDEKIYDKYQKGGIMDFAVNETEYYVSEQDGTTIELYNLKSGDAVGYAISKDKKLCEVIRYSQKVGGVYNENTSEGKIVISGKEYVLSDYYLNNVKSLDSIKLGAEVILYLGDYGQVIYVDEFSSTLKYGFYVKTAQTTGLSVKTLSMVCTEEGELKEFVIADKIKYNGTSMSSAEVKDELLALETKDILLRVIKYSLNANGEINKIYDAEPYSGNVGDAFLKLKTDEARPVLYSDNTDHYAGRSDIYYKNGLFLPLFYLNPNAAIIQVPMSEDNRLNSNYYTSHTTTTLKSFSQNDTTYLKCYGYDVDKTGANFVLWTLEGATSIISDTSSSAVVESVTDGVNEEGELVKIIYMYYGGTWEKFYSLSESKYIEMQSADTLSAIKTIRPGDIVQISTNSENEITAMKINFSYSGNSTYGIAPKGLASDCEITGLNGKRMGYVTGYIYNMDSQGAMIVRNKDMSQIETGTFALKDLHAINFSRGTVVVVNMDRNRDGSIRRAVVSGIEDPTKLESFFNAGKNADFIVQRSYFWDVSLTVVYIN